ncbi:MAG TPA: histidinol dehydrogenase [Dehalococcoidia bacterium]|nr:histidinol dehydrogenase [Dehalococcoidia bacterium]
MRTIRGIDTAREILLKRASASPGSIDEREQAVRRIIADVADRGDAAVMEYTRKFDYAGLESLEVSRDAVKAAYHNITSELHAALELAAERIKAFHTAQLGAISSGTGDTGLSWLVRPLKRVGVYAPHGTAPYPSSLLMTAVPAKVAGVPELILTTPCGSDGTLPAATLVAADIAGVDRIFSIGGAQAIAALALGTVSIPRVDKVCGPGNIYVMLAKKLLFGTVGIDALQGPSEVLIIADDTASVEYCASDLLAQAEHDELAEAVLVTTSAVLAERITEEISRQIQDLSRKEIAETSLEQNGIIMLVDSMDEALEIANLYAPEHLLLMVERAESYLDRIVNAGCIILGDKATVAIGDYVAGPSHVLPTQGTARFSSPLSVLDFVRLTNLISVDEDSLVKLGPAAMTIAEFEGLDAHARAVKRRLEGRGAQ